MKKKQNFNYLLFHTFYCIVQSPYTSNYKIQLLLQYVHNTYYDQKEINHKLCCRLDLKKI